MTFSRLLVAVTGALFLGVHPMAVSANPPGDAARAGAVRAELSRKDPGCLGPAQVDVRNAVVTLKGVVDRPETLYRAVQVSSSVPGRESRRGPAVMQSGGVPLPPAAGAPCAARGGTLPSVMGSRG